MVLALLALGSWGCDVPTDTPSLEQRWRVPGEETAVEVETLLPDGVSVTSGGAAFTAQVDPISFDESLGNLCPACAALNGVTAPKPGFNSSFQETASLPDDVSQATVTQGQIQVVARNGFAFDPLRPAAGVTGTLTMALFDGSTSGTLLDQVVVDGTSESFGSGSTLIKTLSFTGSVSANLVVLVSVNSPGGDPVPIDTGEEITVDASVPTLTISSATVDVAGEDFTIEDTDLDLEDVDKEMVDRVQSGALDMDITNPWGVGATMTLTIQTPSGPINKSFSIPDGSTSTARVDFTKSELRAILGKDNVIMRGTGIVNANASPTTVSPGQEMILDTELDIVIKIGGEDK